MFEYKNKKFRAVVDAFSGPPTTKELENTSLRSHDSVKLKVLDEDSGKDRMVDFDYKGLMAEAQRRENSGDLQGALDMLDIAERLVNGYDYKQSEKVTFKMADTLHKISDNDNSGETKQARLARLDDASDWLNMSDDYNKLDKLANKTEKSKRIVRRGFRLGARAVMNTFKSTIKSTLSRHS